MNIFNIDEAKYYCSGFNKTGSMPDISFKDYLASITRDTVLKETNQDFNDFRYYELREADRLLFLTAVHYKRAHDLLIDSSCAWAYVTMYYGTFYAAKALLSLFGGWIDFSFKNTAIIEAQNGSPGQQELIIRKNKTHINQLSIFTGSHRKFWDLFYATVANILPLLPYPYTWQIGLTPVLNSRTWLIDKRNDVNYDSFCSFNLMCAFQRNFKVRNFSVNLPGDLKLQYQVLHNITELVFYITKQFKIKTDALENFLPIGNRKKKISDKILLTSGHRLLNKSKIYKMFC